MPDTSAEPEEDVYWEWFEEIDDFKRDMRQSGCVYWMAEENGWEAHIFAQAVAEERTIYPLCGSQTRGRGPGNRIRDGYWDRKERHGH